jgi:hypothetical protein
VRNGGGAESGRGGALKLRVEFFDLGFERGNLLVQGARAFGNRVNLLRLFLRGRHTTNFSMPQQNGDKHAERAERDEQQRPRHRKADLAQFAEAQVGERRHGGRGRVFRFRLFQQLAFEGGNFHARGIPFHARVLDGRQRAGEFDVEIFLRPRFVVDGLDFFKRVAEIGDGLDHLLGVAARVELGFFEQAEPAREIVNHFLAAGLEFRLAAAQFLERGTFAFEIVLRAFQFGEFLLRLDDLAVHFVARGRAERVAGGTRRREGRLVRLKIGVNKFGGIVFSSHEATLVLPGKSVKWLC